ncbi:hypothetical protein EDD40_7401 [Saccharothrix texasensis]|uniref:Uncharacterized protein n=1 Tax=Saccharothrix texasensis TaxID=103734 RepID=A0A3N1HHD1_9PSEU|nr:hypothetical protein EDD40_7401 [Saccharothrix texasensis]
MVQRPPPVQETCGVPQEPESCRHLAGRGTPVPAPCFRHVLVNGTPVIQDGKEIPDARPPGDPPAQAPSLISPSRAALQGFADRRAGRVRRCRRGDPQRLDGRQAELCRPRRTRDEAENEAAWAHHPGRTDPHPGITDPIQVTTASGYRGKFTRRPDTANGSACAAFSTSTTTSPDLHGRHFGKHKAVACLDADPARHRAGLTGRRQCRVPEPSEFGTSRTPVPVDEEAWIASPRSALHVLESGLVVGVASNPGSQRSGSAEASGWSTPTSRDAARSVRGPSPAVGLSHSSVTGAGVTTRKR